jgi:type I restriction enzyme S subunit
MSEIKQVQLQNIATFEMGQSPDSITVNDREMGIPFLQGCAEFGSMTPKHIFYCTKPKKVCQIGDILISVRAPVGTLNKADKQYCIGRGLSAVRFNSDYSKNFGWHLLNYWATSLEKVSQGSTFTAISKNDLESLNVIVFPQKEQEKIAEILDKVDSAIALTEALIKKLKQIKAGLLQDLLTRGLDDNGQLRNPDTHPEQFKDSPLGKIPITWEVKTLDDCDIEIIDGDRGIHYPNSNELLSEGFLNTSNVITNGFNSNSLQFITKDKDNKLRTGKLKRNDIVITTRGTVGNTILYDLNINFENIRINSGMVILRNNDKLFDNYFLFISLKNYLLPLGYKKISSGSAQPQLPIKDLKKFNLICPSVEEQEKMAKILDTQERAIEKEEQYLKKLKQKKQGLMQDLLTGKVRVNHL